MPSQSHQFEPEHIPPFHSSPSTPVIQSDDFAELSGPDRPDLILETTVRPSTATTHDIEDILSERAAPTIRPHTTRESLKIVAKHLTRTIATTVAGAAGGLWLGETVSPEHAVGITMSGIFLGMLVGRLGMFTNFKQGVQIRRDLLENLDKALVESTSIDPTVILAVRDHLAVYISGGAHVFRPIDLRRVSISTDSTQDSQTIEDLLNPNNLNAAQRHLIENRGVSLYQRQNAIGFTQVYDLLTLASDQQLGRKAQVALIAYVSEYSPKVLSLRRRSDNNEEKTLTTALILACELAQQTAISGVIECESELEHSNALAVLKDIDTILNIRTTRAAIHAAGFMGAGVTTNHAVPLRDRLLRPHDSVDQRDSLLRPLGGRSEL